MNLYNLIFPVLIGGAAVLGFIYLDGPEAVQEYLDGKADSSQTTENLARPTPVAAARASDCLYSARSDGMVYVEPYVGGYSGCGPYQFTLDEFCADVARLLSGDANPQATYSMGITETYERPLSMSYGEVLELANMCEKAQQRTASQPVGNAYPPSVVQNFMDACMFAGSGQAYCSCAFVEIQKRYTVEEFSVLETRMLNTGQFPEELAGVTANCIP